jgi:hypothetical protein
MSSLAEHLETLKEASKTRLPPDARAVIERFRDELKKSGIADRTLRVGQRAPEFSLSDSNGQSVSSAELLKKGPLVVSFYRGKW